MAPSLALQEAPDHREKEGTQDLGETRVHSSRADETLQILLALTEICSLKSLYCMFTGDPGQPGLSGLPGSYTVQIPHRLQKRDAGNYYFKYSKSY